MFEKVIEQYTTLEPPGKDSWNPFFHEVELYHRLRLFRESWEVIKRIGLPPEECRVLDIGCGVGRSTRVYVELGCKPENITGMDIRPEAVVYAQALNPAIAFVHMRDPSNLSKLGKFHLVVCCTVFSSISKSAERLALAQAAEACVEEGGGVFWWDRLKANDFAGGDLLRPEDYFLNWHVVYRHVCPLHWYPSECLRPLRGLLTLLRPFVDWLGYHSSHMAALLRRDLRGSTNG
jgi:SAM-dependent methyltransferase